MPAYMIVTAVLKDRERFIEGYGKAAAELVARFGGRYVFRGPGATALEGEFGEGASVVISEWPDREAALRFWESAEYAKVRQLREGVADCHVVLIEGRMTP